MDKIFDLAIEHITKYIAQECWIFTNEELRNFAEALINECAEIALKEDFDAHDSILNHFGLLDNERRRD